MKHDIKINHTYRNLPSKQVAVIKFNIMDSSKLTINTIDLLLDP